MPVPVVALVGYTNAGKSTLLNTITGANVMAEDKLFATLDPTTRRTTLPGGRDVLLTDTVGFINNLPTLLIAAFRATLEEINEATVLLHVVDATHPNAAEQMETVLSVLEELGADDRPMITALNKVDRLLPEDATRAEFDAIKLSTVLEGLGEAAVLATNPVLISGGRGWGLDHLLREMERIIQVEAEYVPVVLHAPYHRGDLVDRFHRAGRVESVEHTADATVITGWVPSAEIGQYEAFITPRDGRQPSTKAEVKT